MKFTVRFAILIFILVELLTLLENSHSLNDRSVPDSVREMEALRKLRMNMVDRQLRARGITDERVLRAMETVPRHRFVDPIMRDQAYDDNPLPIGLQQTISQPFIVAYMLAAARIKPNDKLLEIGTGCGYAAAVASLVADEVHTIETIPELGEAAKRRVQDLEYSNIHVTVGDGTMGLPEKAPFDVIIVTAGAPAVPQSLQQQLALNGRMIIPVRKYQFGEDLLRITRISETGFTQESLMDVRFVPLIGEEGYRG